MECICRNINKRVFKLLKQKYMIQNIDIETTLKLLKAFPKDKSLLTPTIEVAKGKYKIKRSKWQRLLKLK